MDIQILKESNNKQTYTFFKDFNIKHSKCFQFDFIQNKEKTLLFNKLTTSLTEEHNKEIIKLEYLTSVRLLCRDSNNLDSFLSNDLLNTLCLLVQSHQIKIATEALKCICNCIFNSQNTKNYFSCDKDFIKQFQDRLEKYSVYPIEFKYFDIRLHFLITAYCENMRNYLLAAVPNLTELLKIDKNETNIDQQINSSINAETLLVEVFKLLFNITLALPMQKCERVNDKHEPVAECDEALNEESHVYYKLVKMTGKLLINVNVDNILFTHAVNLLTNLPLNALQCLIYLNMSSCPYINNMNASNCITNNEIKNNTDVDLSANNFSLSCGRDNDINTNNANNKKISHHKSNENISNCNVSDSNQCNSKSCDEDTNNHIISNSNSSTSRTTQENCSSSTENKSFSEILLDENFSAISRLILYLKLKLETEENKNKSEELAPILKCLSLLCSSHSSIRKFCRIKILPGLKNEVLRLPEEGDTLRNRLCKLLTSPSPTLTNLTADLLFILCKESVSRFVKYSGYGNAAGLLAQRGLMAGGQSSKNQYSSSSDSDTEEYKQLKNQVNPITGRWEEERSDNFAEMTEEQKEFEANKLINQIHRLSSGGLIQPMKIGPDGKPKAVEHVLELLKSDENSDLESN